MNSPLPPLVHRLLRWGGRYMKTDMLYLAKGGFWLSLGQVASSLSSFLLAILFANLLPADTYGTYKYVLSAAGLLAIPALSGIGGALTQAIARGFEGSYIPGLLMRLRWGALGACGGAGLALYYYVQGNMELAVAFALVSPFIPLVEILGMYGAYFSGKKMFRQSTLYFLTTRAVYAGALVLALLFTDNLYIVLASYFIPLTIVHTVLFLTALKKYPPNGKSEPGTLTYGVHLSFNGIISQVSLYLDTILLFHYLGPVGVAIYTFAAAPVKQIRSSYKNLVTLALPKLSERSAVSINALLLNRMMKLLVVGMIIAGAYVAAAPYFFSLLFPDYPESVFYSQILAIILAIELPLVLLGSAVQSRLNVTPHSWLYLRNVPAGAFIVSALLLIPTYGILGVIISRFVSTASSLAIQGIQWNLFVKREREATFRHPEMP